MPVHVADNGSMASEDVGRLDGILTFSIRRDIPMANRHILRCTQNVTLLRWIPGQSEALSFLAD